MDLAFVRAHCHAETGKVLPQTVAKKLEAQSRLECHCTVALRIPFTGTKGPSLNHEKQLQTHYSSYTNLYSWHYALGQVAFSWHPPNPDLSVGQPDGEA